MQIAVCLSVIQILTGPLAAVLGGSSTVWEDGVPMGTGSMGQSKLGALEDRDREVHPWACDEEPGHTRGQWGPM